MRSNALQAQVRAARRARALSQAALAARAGTSRVTIARLEASSARDFRVGTLFRLCDALGLELTATPAGSRSDLETLLARERERSCRLDLRRRHAALAVTLLAARRPRAAALVRRARACVDRWERERLCSRHYISRWRAMLHGPVPRVAQALLLQHGWADALFQNSPWAFALEPAPAWGARTSGSCSLGHASSAASRTRCRTAGGYAPGARGSGEKGRSPLQSRPYSLSLR